MKNNFLFSALLLLTCSGVNSQRNGTDQSIKTGSYVTVSPLSLLDFYAPRLRAGYIQHLADHWKVGLDLGIGSGTGLFSQRESEDDFLFEVRPELYFILKPTSRTFKYLSAEFFYIDQSSVLLDNEYSREDGRDISYDRVDYSRQKYGMHLKFGLFLNFGRHWGMNFYGGVGFRFKTTVFENVVNPQEVTASRHRHGFDTIYDTESSDFRPNPTLGFRVYYRL